MMANAGSASGASGGFRSSISGTSSSICPDRPTEWRSGFRGLKSRTSIRVFDWCRLCQSLASLQHPVTSRSTSVQTRFMKFTVECRPFTSLRGSTGSPSSRRSFARAMSLSHATGTFSERWIAIRRRVGLTRNNGRHIKLIVQDAIYRQSSPQERANR